MYRLFIVACALLLGTAAPSRADGLQRVATDPANDKFMNLLGTVDLVGRSISYLVTHQPGDTLFTHAYLLFPGAPGYGNLGVENGTWRYSLKGNLLVRARRHFTERGVLAVVIDAPSDMQTVFPQSFRASPRYGEDVRAVTEAVERRFGALDWTFVGTSEGTVSATFAGRMLGDVARRVVLTSSFVDGRGRQGNALIDSDIAPITVPVLWVHHQHDPCRYTRYATVKGIAERLKQPLITVSGTEGAKGAPCEAYSEHGFAGREIAAIRAIRTWVRTGVVTPRVEKP